MPQTTGPSSDLTWQEFSTASGSAYVRKRGDCQFCKGRRFHRSTLRSSDITSLILLRYPVRCMRCRQRQVVDFLTASLSLPAGPPVMIGSRKRESWETWTKASNPQLDPQEPHEKNQANNGRE